MIDLLDLRGGRGVVLSLLGVTREPDGTLLAEGYYADTHLRAGRVLRDEHGWKYHLSNSLKPGLYAVGAGLDAYALEKALVLEVVK